MRTYRVVGVVVVLVGTACTASQASSTSASVTTVGRATTTSTSTTLSPAALTEIAELEEQIATLEEVQGRIEEEIRTAGEAEEEPPFINPAGMDYLEGLDIGPELTPEDLGGVPSETIGLSMGPAIVFLNTDGTAIGHLPDWMFSGGDTDARMLEDPGGNRWLVNRDGLEPLGAFRWTLATGEVIASSQPDGVNNGWKYTMSDGDEVVWEWAGELRISKDGKVATALEIESSRDTYRVAASTLVDPAVGIIELPPGCWVTSVLDDGGYLLACSLPRPDGYLIDSLELMELSGERTFIVAGPGVDLPIPSGHWRWAEPSPDGSVILAQWSGECEIPTAFWIADGDARPFTGGDPYEAPDSYAAGWLQDGRAVIALWGSPACGIAAENPGIYLASSPTDLELIYPLGEQSPHVWVWSWTD